MRTLLPAENAGLDSVRIAEAVRQPPRAAERFGETDRPPVNEMFASPRRIAVPTKWDGIFFRQQFGVHQK